MFSSFGFSLSSGSLCGKLLRRCVGPHVPGRRRILDKSRGSFVVGSLSAEEEEGEHVRLVIVDLLFQDANMWNANDQIAFLQAALVPDCKELFDGVSQSESGALGLSDKRSALEAMALKISLTSTKTHLHWVHRRSSVSRCYHPRGNDYEC